MKLESPIKVTSDSQKNFLKISFSGKITVKDISSLKEQISRELIHIKKGFTLLTDLTDLISMEIKCAYFIKKAMELMRDHDIGFIIRVIPDASKDIGLGIMSQFHYPKRLQMVTVKNRKEAEIKLMDQANDSLNA